MMSGFSSNFSNMPPSVGVNDIPGNGPDDVETDRMSLIPIMEKAAADYLLTKHPAQFIAVLCRGLKCTPEQARTFITIIFQSGWMKGHRWAYKELIRNLKDQLNKRDVV